jgi:transposase-like protein
MVRRLGWLGWKSSAIGPRLGVTSNWVGSFARDYNIRLRDNYDQYRRAVGRTTAYLVVETDATLSDLARIYGHSRKSIRRWAKEYSEYETPATNGVERTWNVDVQVPPHVDSEVGVDTGAYRWKTVAHGERNHYVENDASSVEPLDVSASVREDLTSNLS